MTSGSVSQTNTLGVMRD